MKPPVVALVWALLVSALLVPDSVAALPRVFTDDFDRSTLGSDWVVDAGDFAVSSNQLAELSGERFLDAQMRYMADATESDDQFAKLRIVAAATHTWGFIFRAASSPGDHYEVHPPIGTNEWRWERYDPGFVERMGECTGDVPVADGHWIGATIEGTGPDTVVSVYRWDDDPDLGGPVDVVGNWGAPDCVISSAGPTFVDFGTTVGIRSYTGSSSTAGFADSWTAGDLAAVAATCGDGVVEGAEICDDGNTVSGDGCRDDCTVEMCGDGLLDPGESCDDGNLVDGDGCRSDCTQELCGDGILDPGETCDDGNTVSGDGCDASCQAEPPLTCGDGVLDTELGEECDDGNNVSGDGCRDNCTLEVCGDGILDSPTEECDDGNNLGGDGCRSDCTLEVCGDGILDPQEQCETDADCASGETCVACGCQPPGVIFADDFDRSSLGADWSVDAGTYGVSGNQLVESSGSTFLSTQVRYVAATLATPDQFAKLRIASAATHTWGFMFRAGSAPGDHYEVHPPIGTDEWRWERYDPGFVQRMGDCVGDAVVGDGDWIGATITGSGSATLVDVYRWDGDPDGGGPVDIAGNWGAPDCSMTGAVSPIYVDAGDHVGIRAYTGSSGASGSADDWTAGDLLVASAVCGDGILDPGEACDDGNDVSGDGCRADCTSEVCGDGILDPQEECDDGNDLFGDGCRPDCTAEVCGDGFLDPGEECDDGNTLAGDGCDASCNLEPPPGCGDGFLDAGEECDDGNNVSGDGCRADCTAEVCGDGILDAGEQCDDGNTVDGDGCRADCSLEICGDGILDPQEQCDDGNTVDGDGCRADCTTEVCGDGILDPQEQCDDGNTVDGDGCRADCTAEVCGDGILDPGEQCELDADCSAGEVCVACACSPPALSFSDDFDRTTLGSDWVVDAGSFSISADHLVEDSGQKFLGAQMRYVAGTTVGPDQYGKLQILSAATHTFGFMFRAGPAPGAHYEVHPPLGTREWRWERYDPAFVERVGSCLGTETVGDGDWIGAAIAGSGTDTEVYGWRWDGDPDLGGPVDILGNWGPPDCVLAPLEGSPSVDAGNHVGIRAYTGSSRSSGHADDWFAGDFDGQTQAPAPSPIELILDSSGAGEPGSLRDPDGVVVDDAGNVFVAACGSGPSNEGVWRVTPEGQITKILGNEGDGVNSLSCAVGLALDSVGNLYVAAFLSDNVFRVAPGGAVSQVIGPGGAGPGRELQGPLGVAVGAGDQVFVTGHFSDNVLVLRPDSSVDEVLSASDGLLRPFGVAIDSLGDAFVAGFGSDEVYRVPATGTPEVVLDATGGGAPGGLLAPHGITFDSEDNLYVTGNESDNVLRRTPAGVVTEILDVTGDGAGNGLDNPTCVAVDADRNVYVAGFFTDNVLQVTPTGSVAQIIGPAGDGVNGFVGPSDFCLAVDAGGDVYATGTLEDNTFRIRP